MKRQPIVSAAAFFVFVFPTVETRKSVGECVDKSRTPTDCIFCPLPLYWRHKGGVPMTVYLDVVMVLNFLVDLLLLLGAGRLCGMKTQWRRALLAAALGGVYAGFCLLPAFSFLGSLFWRMVFLLIMVVITYGYSKSALRRGAVFIFLSLALGGAAYGMGNGGFVGIICAGGVIFLLCGFGLRRPVGSRVYLPVELSHNGKHLAITALQDTGNTLRDPITGTQVLIVGPEVAQKLIGLTPWQLANPVESMGLIPGLRLIPYRTVGNPTGLLLGMKLQKVKIGSGEGSTLVAFAPERIGTDGAYQALTGGTE